MNDLVDIGLIFKLRATHITKEMIDDCCAIGALEGIRNVKIEDIVGSELLTLEKKCRISLKEFETLESDIRQLYQTLQQQTDMCTLFMRYIEFKEAPNTTIEGYKGTLSVYKRSNTMPIRQRLVLYKEAVNRLCQAYDSCEECPLYRVEEDCCLLDSEADCYES